jgi:hypothetical protein
MRRAALALVLLACLIAALALLSDPTSAPSGQAPHRSALPQAEPPLSAAAAGDEPAALSPARAPATAGVASWTITVLVRDRDGDAPIAGAAVSADAADAGGDRRPARARAMTDESGACELAWAPSPHDRIEVRAHGYVTRRVSIDRAMSRSGRVPIWLDRGVARELTVFDASTREPVPGVGAHLRRHAQQRRRSNLFATGEQRFGFVLDRPDAISDEAGRLSLTVPADAVTMLALCKVGYAVTTVDRLPAGREDLQLAIEPADPTTVVVVDEQGERLADRKVVMHLDRVSFTTATAENGACVFPSGSNSSAATFSAVPDLDRSASFAFHAQLTAPIEQEVRFPTQDPVVLRDDRAALNAVRVRWTPGAGRIALAARLAPNPLLAGRSDTPPGTSDRLVTDYADGEALLRRIGDVTDVVARSPDGIHRADCRGLDAVDLRLERAATSSLRVAVTTEDEQYVELHAEDPLLGALVDPVGAPWTSRRTTNGEALFEHLPAAEYTVRVRSIRFVPTTIEVRDATTLSLAPSPTASLSGRVLGTVGRPTVVARSASSGRGVETVLGDADGSFRFDELPCGTYTLHARQADFDRNPDALSIERILHGTVPRTVDLPPDGLADVELVWPDVLGPLHVAVRGEAIDEPADVLLSRVHPYDRVGSTGDSWLKPLHPDGICVFSGIDRSSTWLVAVRGKDTGRVFAFDKVFPNTEEAALALRPRVARVDWGGVGECSLVLAADGDAARELFFTAVPVDGEHDSRRAWIDLAVGDYFLVETALTQPYRGGLTHLRRVRIAPDTARLR